MREKGAYQTIVDTMAAELRHIEDAETFIQMAREEDDASLAEEALPELEEADKRLFLGENAKGFYGFPDLPVPERIKNMVED